MNINKATVDLVKRWEGFEAEAYIDAVGKWTIGYGTTADAGVGIVPKRGMKITQAEAEKYLMLGLEKFANSIRTHIKVPINDNEFGAFLSLAYNIGPTAFIGSTALRRFNAGDKKGAAEAITWWNKGTVDGKKVVLRGLVNRRADEVKLFNTPVSGRKRWLN